MPSLERSRGKGGVLHRMGPAEEELPRRHPVQVILVPQFHVADTLAGQGLLPGNHVGSLFQVILIGVSHRLAVSRFKIEVIHPLDFLEVLWQQCPPALPILMTDHKSHVSHQCITSPFCIYYTINSATCPIDFVNKSLNFVKICKKAKKEEGHLDLPLIGMITPPRWT